MPREPVTAFVSLGANLGDALETVLAAVQDVARLPDTELTGCSRFYRTAPHEASGPDFINAVVCLATRLTAPHLLQALQQLELEAGRERPYVNAPRTLDLDVLLYGESCIDSPRLTVPHPRMWARAFVLYPLADLAPERVSAEILASMANQPVQPLALA